MKNAWKCGARCVLNIAILLSFAVGCSSFNRQPVAVIAVSPDAGYAPLEVSLDGRGSYDRDGSVVRYEWTLGDGEITCDSHLTHVYTGHANYRVILCVTDNDGATASDEVSIPVSRLDLTGTWSGTIRNDVDVPLRGPYALDLLLWQQASSNTLSGTVEWAAVTGYSISIPIVTGYVAGTDLDIMASGIYSPNPGLLPYVWYSVHLVGSFESGGLQGTGSWDDGATFRWTAWKR